MVMRRYRRFTLLVKLREAASLDILLGLVKILKQSASVFLQVIVGSKRISSLFSLAIRLVAFRLGVSEKFPWYCGGLIGFILGSIRRIRVVASRAHR